MDRMFNMTARMNKFTPDVLSFCLGCRAHQNLPKRIALCASWDWDSGEI